MIETKIFCTWRNQKIKMINDPPFNISKLFIFLVNICTVKFIFNSIPTCSDSYQNRTVVIMTSFLQFYYHGMRTLKQIIDNFLPFFSTTVFLSWYFLPKGCLKKDDFFSKNNNFFDLNLNVWQKQRQNIHPWLKCDDWQFKFDCSICTWINLTR